MSARHRRSEAALWRLLGRYAGPLLVAAVASSVGFTLAAAYVMANP